MEAHIEDKAPIADQPILCINIDTEDDCRIRAHTHVAPGGLLCGSVTVGEGTLIGAGSVIKEVTAIRSRTTVGLGTIVIPIAADGQTVVDLPARGTDAI